MNKHQVTIVGGGMIGAALALGLSRLGLDVALVDSHRPEPFTSSQPADLRISALSMATVNLLTELEVWSTVVAMRACPYRSLETWEYPQCRTRFNASDIGVEQLGYMVENRIIQLALWQAFETAPITLYCPDSLEALSTDSESVRLTLQSGQVIESQWLVGADGANSKVRQFTDIGVTAWDYRHHCMLINVDTHREQQDTTWQQFFPTGPRSFLPFIGSQASLVWYDEPKRIQQLMAMPDHQLEDEIHQSFPKELGSISVLQKGAFPLVRRHAQRYYKGRTILVGDAAHTINPLAGQGANLGFKDVKVLLEEVRKSGSISDIVTRKYYQKRSIDNLAMQTGMDLFYKTFSNELGPLKLVRNAMLKVANMPGPIKNDILKYAIGMK